MTPDWTTAPWRKATGSDTTGCVEVACSAGTIGVRDTMDRGGPMLQFTMPEWTAFVSSLGRTAPDRQV